MYTYAQAKAVVIQGLSADIEAHCCGAFEQVGALFDQCDGYLPRESGEEFKKLFIALGFWDAWIHACDDNWDYFRGIAQADWPVLAGEIVRLVSADQEVEDATVLAYFDVVNHGGMWHRARNLLY